MRRATAGTLRWRNREVLPRPEIEGSAGESGDGSDWTWALVRAVAGGTELRTVDGRPGADQSLPGAQAEKRSAGCRSHSEADDGGSLPPGVGTESGESGPA